MKWEYLSEYVTVDSGDTRYLTEYLNKNGKDGWELVNWRLSNSTMFKLVYQVVFKRPMQ